MESADDRKVENLGRRISGAIRRMMEESIVDEKVVNLCLKEIKLALLQTDLQFKLVSDFQTNVMNRVQSADKKKIIQAIFDELCKLLDPGKLSFSLVKKQTRIVMFVGLQGSGRSRACVQFANYYKKEGFHPAIVSADTFRASNFDNLMQSTMAATIPLYGSFMQSDPVAKNAVSGFNWFKKHCYGIRRTYDLIIIDTSDRHAKVSSLIEEMRTVSEATKPDLVIFVVDSGNGLAAFHQVQSFNETVKVGAVIMTGVNYDRKGTGEALSTITATKTPVMFIGRGERLEEFEVFDIKAFVSRLLGLREMLGFKEDVPVAQQPKILTNYTLRIYYMLVHIPNEIIPVFGHLVRGYILNEESERKNRLRKLHILNSMQNEDLDARLQNILTCSFIARIAKSSGSGVRDVLLVMEDHKIRVGLFELLDARCPHPVCLYFEKIIPGVIMAAEIENKPAKRKKPMSSEAEEEEEGEESNKLRNKEELIKIIESGYQERMNSKMVKLHSTVNGRKRKPEEEEKIKKRDEDSIAKLRAFYGRPLEQIKNDKENYKMKAVVVEEAQVVAEQH